MAGGTIAFERSNATGSYLEGKIEWSSVANNEANTSNLTVTLYVRKRSTTQQLTEPTLGNWRCTVKIGDETFEPRPNKTVLQSYVLLWTKTIENIPHNQDGTLSVEIDAKIQGPAGSSGYSEKTTTGTGVAVMDTIPRASDIYTAADTPLGRNVYISWVPASADFYYRIRLALGAWSYETDSIKPNSTRPQYYGGYTLPYDLANEIGGDKTSGKVTVTLTTYAASGEAIGSFAKEFTARIDESPMTRPRIAMSISPIGVSGDLSDIYLQTASKVQATISATAKYGATIESSTILIGGVDQKGLTSSLLSEHGDVVVTGVVTDSRGFQSTVEETISVYRYYKPTLVNPSISRDKREDMENAEYKSLRITASREYASVGGMNTCVIEYQCVAASRDFGSDWLVALSESDAANSINSIFLVDQLDLGTSYKARVRVRDKVNASTPFVVDVPTERVYWHRDGARGSFTFGGRVEEDNTFSITDDKIFKACDALEVSKDFVTMRVPAVDRFGTPVSNGMTTNSDNTDPNLTLEEWILTTHENAPISGQAFYIHTVFSSAKRLDASRLQFAQPYDAGGVYYRAYSDGVWSGWEKLANASDIQIGTIPIDKGGTGATTAAEARSNLGLNPVPLWENESPTSNYGASTFPSIKKDLSPYRFILVHFKATASGNTYAGSVLVPVDDTATGNTSDNAKGFTHFQYKPASANHYDRYVRASSTEIVISTGRTITSFSDTTWSVDNSLLVPVAIYGII